MSTPSLDPSTTVAPDQQGIGDSPPPQARPTNTGGRLYRVIWRWHFYAGIIIAPVLLIVSATGALYVFKDELEALIYPGVTYVQPATERAPFERQVALAREAAGPPAQIAFMQVFLNPKRATTFAIRGKTFQYVYIDQYRGRHLGSIASGGFFDIVLSLHRTLFLGTTGRIVVELTTCWTVVLVITGVYLWWPSKSDQIWGVWLPRLRAKPYIILRDLHSLSGFYIAAIAITIALTGLIYSYVWGTGFQYAARKTDAYDMFSKPMQSRSPPDAKDVSIDRIVEVAKQKLPGNNLTVWFPRAPNAVYLVTANNDQGPKVNEILFIDRASGEILEDRGVSQTKLMYCLESWDYSLHVGTIWGLPTKILWFITCLILMTAPLTGLWMWWERRPAGQLGLPRRVNARRPLWLIVTVMATCLLLPALGLSVIVVFLGDHLAALFRKQQ